VAPGKLLVVGSGYHLGNLTLETKAAIELADRVMYLVIDGDIAQWIRAHARATENLGLHYEVGKSRAVVYREMFEAILQRVREGDSVCAIFYGHPGVMALTPHAVVAVARQEGYEARMLPAVSAEDFIFADLGLDPGAWGYQTYEASYFVLKRPRIEVRAVLVLWQALFVGERRVPGGISRDGLKDLRDSLLEHYPPSHRMLFYEIGPGFGAKPTKVAFSLDEMDRLDVDLFSTLVVPPLADGV
jgi:hypothetical protein